MGFGVLDKTSLVSVPGTVQLADDDFQQAHGHRLDLKRNVNGIILNPQPSEDPNDPLNWSYLKKLAVIATLGLGSCICASTFGPMLTASLVVLATEFDHSLTDITVLTGYLLLTTACTAPLMSTLARKFGKRPVFLLSSFMGLIGSIVCATSHSYQTLLAGRIIQGFSVCAYESLVITTIGDIFFVHERGLYVSMIVFVLNCVSNLSSVVCGSITKALGWRYLFYFAIFAVGLQLILVLFLVPETTYHRDRVYETDETANVDLQELAKIEHRHDKTVVGTSLGDPHTRESAMVLSPRKKTYWQEMKICNGSLSDDNILQSLLAPFLCCTNLAILWMVVVAGTVTSFYVAVSYIIAQIFAAPPYDYGTAQIGYISLGPFIGGSVATVALYFVSDSIPVWIAKRNRGIYEPEFRLVQMVFGLLAGLGFFLFGYTTSNKDGVYLVSFLWGLCLFGCGFVISPASAYAIDAFRDLSQESFIAAMSFKNFLFFGYTYFMNSWVATSGSAIPFYVFGGVSIGLVSTTVIVYIWGKRYRALWFRHNIMDKLHVRTQGNLQ